ncbi:MAG TPA: RT0821/Lpp0805 family surface protein [Gammaproteobacteria bacterium]|nr:RT0821/Lpp0805 family surface protein [Gammaproteobacteria bacterium]
MKIKHRPLLCSCTLAVGVILLSPPAPADPPSWAPAHGYRARHGDTDYHHRRAENDARSARGDDEGRRERRGNDDRMRVRRDDRYARLPWSADHGPSRYIQQGHCNRAAVGTIIGGALGGVVGSQVGKGDGRTAATIAGAVAGMFIGNAVGRSMDEADQACTGQALEYAPDGQSVQWRNPDTDERYRVTPTRTYQNRSGRYCRQYTSDGYVDGKVRQLHGTACRQPDGTWKLAGK